MSSQQSSAELVYRRDKEKAARYSSVLATPSIIAVPAEHATLLVGALWTQEPRCPPVPADSQLLRRDIWSPLTGVAPGAVATCEKAICTNNVLASYRHAMSVETMRGMAWKVS